jgi:hypothetical protein
VDNGDRGVGGEVLVGGCGLGSNSGVDSSGLDSGGRALDRGANNGVSNGDRGVGVNGDGDRGADADGGIRDVGGDGGDNSDRQLGENNSSINNDNTGNKKESDKIDKRDDESNVMDVDFILPLLWTIENRLAKGENVFIYCNDMHGRYVKMHVSSCILKLTLNLTLSANLPISFSLTLC